MQRIVQLEINVWGLQPVDAVPVNILSLSVHNGGLLMVAEDDTEIVGFTVAFPARKNNKWILWSHMTGIHPDYQGKSIGTRLKLLQREWAANNDYPAISWTFDPLQAANANFNFNRLGAFAMVYHENFYGEMHDEINSTGLPSDRLEVFWPVHSRKAMEHVEEPDLFLVDATGTQFPIETALNQVAISIPPPRIEQSKLQLWQLALREAFRQCFAAGFTVYKFVRTRNAGYYLLARLDV
jgi:predicted GNAT superfamily acetyltransferase